VDQFEKWLLALLCISMTLVLWWRDRSILGPFIFLDETRYFDLALRMFRDHLYYGVTDYNPLYSLILAPLFSLGSLSRTYDAARLLNCILWSLATIPIYFVARRFVPKLPAVFVSLATGLGPASVYTSMVRAEPLFFLLAGLVVLLFLRMSELPERRRICACGVATGLLFLTKQAGIAFLLAILASLCYEAIQNSDWVTTSRKCAWFVGSCACITVPWVLRNLRTPGSGVLGYSHWTNKMAVEFALIRFFPAVAINLSYAIIGLFGIFFVWYCTVSWRLLRSRLSKSVFALFAFFTFALLVCDLAIAALISMVSPHNANAFYYLNGRYLDVVFPWILTLAYVAIDGRDASDPAQLPSSIIWCLASCAILWWCSPLGAVSASACADNPYLVFLSQFYEGRTGIFWPAVRHVATSAKLSLAFAPAVLLLISLLVSRRAAWVFGAGVFLMIVLGFNAADFTQRVASTQYPINRLTKQMVSAGVEQLDLAVDVDMVPDVSPLAFWFSHRSDRWQSMSADLFRVPVSFEFGTTNLPSRGGIVGIRAPWVGTSFFNEQQGYGFVETPVGEVSACPGHDLAADGRPHQYVFGNTAAKFVIRVPDGAYSVTALIRGEQNGCQQRKVNFDLELGACRLNVAPGAGNVIEMPFECRATPVNGRLSLSLKPQPGSAWAIDRLDVRSSDTRPLSSPRFFLTDKILNLPVRWQDHPLRVYETHR
jgi:hypothetical protein